MHQLCGTALTRTESGPLQARWMHGPIRDAAGWNRPLRGGLCAAMGGLLLLEADLEYDRVRAVGKGQIAQHGFPVDGVGVRGVDVHPQHVLAPGGQGDPFVADLEQDFFAVLVPKIIASLEREEIGLVKAGDGPGLGLFQGEVQAVDVAGHLSNGACDHGVTAAAVRGAGLDEGEAGRDLEVDAGRRQGSGLALKKADKRLGGLVGEGPARQGQDQDRAKDWQATEKRSSEHGRIP